MILLIIGKIWFENAKNKQKMRIGAGVTKSKG
jgi:hypothetical protein